ncbi:hypothetical protein TNIN_434581 [Trichonephila inaurata madagascariensis]|uniref:Uncharacterized protein n=1 Tax=Trichonephila inaurata madagascariensis TaxID=2747483 RepID=A0A8X6YVG5_9ARAC|nr:hypothetical protein TNIN_434581 [Trichonephila inaurata madagascariensis]
MTRLNCDYLVAIQWMRYQSRWIPNRILFVNPYDNRRVEIRPSLDSLQSFTYHDVVQNLKSIEPLYEDNDWNGNDTIRVPVLDFEDFLKFHLVKDYLQKEDRGWDFVIGAMDQATYMYLDQVLPNVVHYFAEKQPFDTLLNETVKLWK